MGIAMLKVQPKNTKAAVEKYTMYIGFRAREHSWEEKGFFDEQHDRGADGQRFIDTVTSHPALQHSQTIKMHALIISLKEDQFRTFRENGGDYKQLVRDYMKDLEERKGMKLTWVAAVHETTKHPHVHVHVMSVGETDEGKNKRLYLNKEDFAWSRAQLDKHLEPYMPNEKQQARENQQHREQHEKHSSTRSIVGALSKVLYDSDKGPQSLMDNPARRRRSRRDKSRIQVQREAENQLGQAPDQQGPNR